MICLAVNTANTLLSIALVKGTDVLYQFETVETRDQGNLILSHIKKGLQENKLNYSDIDLLAVVTGPGSFTGIRIGLAAMQGIALAANIPIMGLSSFDLYQGADIIALESWREELYLKKSDQPPVSLSPEDFVKNLDKDKEFTISGDTAEKIRNLLPKAFIKNKMATAVDAAHIALQKMKVGQAFEKPVPFYLREPDVTLSSKNRKTEGL